jgi:hypothetical protein
MASPQLNLRVHHYCLMPCCTLRCTSHASLCALVVLLTCVGFALAVFVQLCMAVSCQRCDTKVYHQVCIEKFLKVCRADVDSFIGASAQSAGQRAETMRADSM